MNLVRYRVSCASSDTPGPSGHPLHRRERATREKAFEAVRKNNLDHTDPPPNLQVDRACFPWRVEARVIGPWGEPGDVEEQAHYLGEEIADQERAKAEEASA